MKPNWWRILYVLFHALPLTAMFLLNCWTLSEGPAVHDAFSVTMLTSVTISALLALMWVGILSEGEKVTPVHKVYALFLGGPLGLVVTPIILATRIFPRINNFLKRKSRAT